MKYTLKGKQICHKNLSGNPTPWNKAGGNRDFSVVLNEDEAAELASYGFNVKRFINKQTGEPGDPYLKVKVNLRPDENGKVPLYLVTEDNVVTQLKVNSVASIDHTIIRFVDMTINSYNYNAGGRTGITAYLDKMYVNIIEDELEKKYANFMQDNDDDDNIMEDISFD